MRASEEEGNHDDGEGERCSGGDLTRVAGGDAAIVAESVSGFIYTKPKRKIGSGVGPFGGAIVRCSASLAAVWTINGAYDRQ